MTSQTTRVYWGNLFYFIKKCGQELLPFTEKGHLSNTENKQHAFQLSLLALKDRTLLTIAQKKRTTASQTATCKILKLVPRKVHKIYRTFRILYEDHNAFSSLNISFSLSQKQKQGFSHKGLKAHFLEDELQSWPGWPGEHWWEFQFHAFLYSYKWGCQNVIVKKNYL